ncbi:hypothetical protein [Wolbachia endosymbiont of Ctenocephalides felis wCfeT]|uniref:hypothetical protein n=1 Tax=Wolbachia endosymbiont of Ctenocephalides felis wCfeT TaxID=2732593 RepID=UPI001447C443|nr:hypothetical protein [Wolbachia endosymbiont of Ctenocephalides felis wCfeT]
MTVGIVIAIIISILILVFTLFCFLFARKEVAKGQLASTADAQVAMFQVIQLYKSKTKYVVVLMKMQKIKTKMNM